jgi:nucleoporin GLE1
VKMLAILYEGVTVGLEGGIVIGGETPEGKASRTRVQLQVERIMGFIVSFIAQELFHDR